MSTAEEAVNDILSHYGRKGMKWGVKSRNDKRTEKHAKKLKKSEAKFQKFIQSDRAKAQIHNSVISTMNNHHIPRINAKYAEAYHAGHLKDPNHPSYKQYNKDFMNAYMSELRKHTANLTDSTGTKKLKVIDRSDTRKSNEWAFDLVAEERVTHADVEATLKIRLIKDVDGWITGFELMNNSITQSAIDDILAHYGKKGMKWGVRTATPRSLSTTVKPGRFRKTKVKVKGGRGQPAHSEAVAAREKQRILKKSGVNALSNKDLQMLQTRLNLEQNVSRLSKSKRTKAGEEYVINQLKKGGKKAVKAAAVAA